MQEHSTLQWIGLVWCILGPAAGLVLGYMSNRKKTTHDQMAIEIVPATASASADGRRHDGVERHRCATTAAIDRSTHSDTRAFA